MKLKPRFKQLTAQCVLLLTALIRHGALWQSNRVHQDKRALAGRVGASMRCGLYPLRLLSVSTLGRWLSLIVLTMLIALPQLANALGLTPPKPAPTEWVEKSTELIQEDFLRIENMPKQLSIDALSPEEVLAIQRKVYDWAIATHSPQSPTFGCFAWMFKKNGALVQPVGFSFFAPYVKSQRFSSLKVNGVLRQDLQIGGSYDGSTHIEAAFSLSSMRPLNLQDPIEPDMFDWMRLKRRTFDESNELKNYYRIAAFTAYFHDGTREREAQQKYARKNKLAEGVNVVSSRARCSYLDKTCRVYSIKINQLSWVPIGSSIGTNSLEALGMQNKQFIDQEYFIEDSCPGRRGASYQYEDVGSISRVFGYTVNEIYTDIKKLPSRMFAADKKNTLIQTQLKPFIFSDGKR